MLRIGKRRMAFGGMVVALGLLAAACGGGASASTVGSGDATLRIVSPSDNASVGEPFTVRFDSSVPIGEPSTGDHHVHLCFDGASCDDVAGSVIAYSNTAQVSSLAPGRHTIEASLRNADHSAAGVTETITVTVTKAGSQSSTTPSPSAAGGPGSYGY